MGTRRLRRRPLLPISLSPSTHFKRASLLPLPPTAPWWSLFPLSSAWTCCRTTQCLPRRAHAPPFALSASAWSHEACCVLPPQRFVLWRNASLRPFSQPLQTHVRVRSKAAALIVAAAYRLAVTDLQAFDKASGVGPCTRNGFAALCTEASMALMGCLPCEHHVQLGCPACSQSISNHGAAGAPSSRRPHAKQGAHLFWHTSCTQRKPWLSPTALPLSWSFSSPVHGIFGFHCRM